MIPTGVSGALHNFIINVDELNIKYIIFVLINWVYVKKDSQIIAFGLIYVLQIWRCMYKHNLDLTERFCFHRQVNVVR